MFDDDNDYFKINAKKSEGSKQKMVVALDFASRKVIESTQGDLKLKQMLLEDSIKHLKRVEEVYRNIQKQSQKVLPVQNVSLNCCKFFMSFYYLIFYVAESLFQKKKFYNVQLFV